MSDRLTTAEEGAKKPILQSNSAWKGALIIAELRSNLAAAESRAASAEAEIERLKAKIALLDFQISLREKPVYSRRQLIARAEAAESVASALRDRVATLESENARLNIAFWVLADSGHGGGMNEVRKWFNSGTAKPIPWPGGACFNEWAAERGIVNRDGFMEFALRAGPLPQETGSDG